MWASYSKAFCIALITEGAWGSFSKALSIESIPLFREGRSTCSVISIDFAKGVHEF
jgi:hypothetical protein